jgi:hypothetical protein
MSHSLVLGAFWRRKFLVSAHHTRQKMTKEAVHSKKEGKETQKKAKEAARQKIRNTSIESKKERVGSNNNHVEDS